MENKISNLTTADIVKLWTKGCEWKLNREKYLIERDICSIELATDLSIVLTDESTSEEKKYYAMIVFNGYINYQKTKIAPEQYISMVILLQKTIAEKEIEIKNDFIKKGEFNLNMLMDTVNR